MTITYGLQIGEKAQRETGAKARMTSNSGIQLGVVAEPEKHLVVQRRGKEDTKSAPDVLDVI